MRLIKQSVLYFQEGNSDKVYETDLCDVGNDKYVVNFRYGRRGANLKEGSKTPVPVSLQEAEKIYDAVVNEKIGKGYTGSPGVPASKPLAADFLSAVSLPATANLSALPEGRNRSILQRLQNDAGAGRLSRASSWKLTRVIWKAGEYKIREASPYLVQLFTRGDTLHQYCCTWSLVRCGDREVIPALQAIRENHPAPVVTRIAAAGLLHWEEGDNKEQLIQQYIRLLPVVLQEAIQRKDILSLGNLVKQQQLEQAPTDWREHLYLLSTTITWIRPVVKSMLASIPLQPGSFSYVRSIFKLAELLDDFEITGLLSCRFERETEFFSHKIPAKDLKQETYIEAIETFVNPNKELKKNSSRLAYSQKTRWYLHKRVRRRLNMLATIQSTDYVRLATALLINYSRTRDLKEAFTVHDNKYLNGSYQNVEIRYPVNAQAIFLHMILNADNPEMELTSKHIWRLRLLPTRRRNQSADAPSGLGSLIKKITGLFSSKKQTPQPEPAPAAPAVVNYTPHLDLWNKMPQAYIQLLIEAELDEVLEFAATQLTNHPSYKQIKDKLDTDTLKKLVRSPYSIVAELGYAVIKERYLLETPPAELVAAMLDSVVKDARNKAKEWTETNVRTFFQDSGFIKDLVFASFADIRSWGKELIRNHTLSADIKQAAVGKSIAAMMGINTETTDNTLLNDAADTLFGLFSNELRQVNVSVVSDLLHHPVSPVLLFGLRLLKHKKSDWKGEELKGSGLTDLLHHTYEPVRQEIVGLLTGLPDTDLLHFKDELINACLSSWPDVREGVKPLLQRMAKADPAFGYTATETLMPFLLRKEIYEGQHEFLAELLGNELSDYLQNANKQMALNLLYGNYAPAQKLGIVILEKYTDPSTLTVPQVVALGNHENLAVRNWSWNFYEQHTSRIKYESAAAIRLLESKWTDTRAFAMKYFREAFEEKDWEPEVLIGMSDSIKPEVEAFGRELITQYFNDTNGTQYLLKLSQHPSEKMQLFATNYMERFAGNDIGKIRELEFYFRSVLTRVNKSRIAKDRIFLFLLAEGMRSEEAAKTVSTIISDISALAAIGDKAKCIDLLIQLKAIYDIDVPLQVKPVETRA